MDNQQGPCIAHGTLLNVMWQPGWDGSLGKNGYMCTYESLCCLPETITTVFISLSSVQFSRSVVSDSLRPHGLQHARLPCSSPTPGSLLKLMSISSVMPSNHLILCCPSCLQSFPASGSFPMSQFFPSGGQSIGVSASASVLPMNIQD